MMNDSDSDPASTVADPQTALPLGDDRVASAKDADAAAKTATKKTARKTARKSVTKKTATKKTATKKTATRKTAAKKAAKDASETETAGEEKPATAETAHQEKSSIVKKSSADQKESTTPDEKDSATAPAKERSTAHPSSSEESPRSPAVSKPKVVDASAHLDLTQPSAQVSIPRIPERSREVFESYSSDDDPELKPASEKKAPQRLPMEEVSEDRTSSQISAEKSSPAKNSAKEKSSTAGANYDDELPNGGKTSKDSSPNDEDRMEQKPRDDKPEKREKDVSASEDRPPRQQDRREDYQRGPRSHQNQNKPYQGGHGGYGGGQGGPQGGQHPHSGSMGKKQRKNQQKQKRQPRQKGTYIPGGRRESFGAEQWDPIEVGFLPDEPLFDSYEDMVIEAEKLAGEGEPIHLRELLEMSLGELVDRAEELELEPAGIPNRIELFDLILNHAADQGQPILAEGILEITADGFGLLVYDFQNYKVRAQSVFVPKQVIERFGLRRGVLVTGRVAPPRDGETTPALLAVDAVMGKEPEEYHNAPLFEELTPYYPTERILLECDPDVKWHNLSMRAIDLLTPVGLGQRGLIVAPPRTGKTVLQQGIANAVLRNKEKAKLIILLVDERPEEVTDFRRMVKGAEVIASTFDQDAESHVHAAEMVIEKSRRMVEMGKHVIILLDSITRLARAYNALAANSGKILSGGVEATALQKPKRFFGSARNIEGGGSLTILGTALVETGSRMDEVIFEEFKGTGNMELHLDRALSDKRIFPAIGLERSGTRKEELLYHPDEMQKVYSLRRAMKGVPPPEAMEMLLTRIRKTHNNAEFLMALNR